MSRDASPRGALSQPTTRKCGVHCKNAAVMNRFLPDLGSGSALLLLAAVVSVAVAYVRPGDARLPEPARLASAWPAARRSDRFAHLFWQGLMLAVMAVLVAWGGMRSATSPVLGAGLGASYGGTPGGPNTLIGSIDGLWLGLCSLASWAGIQLVLRLARRRWLWVDMCLPFQALLVLGLALWLGPFHWPTLLLICGLLFAAQWIAALSVLLQRRPKAAPAWPAALAVAFLGLAFALLAVLTWQVPSGSTGHRLLAAAAWGLPFLAALLALAVVVFSTQTPREEQDSTPTQIEQRVREVTAELELSYLQLADQKVQQVTERERKRIAADLHDDLGAKLLTIVHTSDSERISTLAREALEEMRLSVRGLTGRPVQLADAMGDWRAETVSRLAQAGIDSDWHAPEELPQMLSSRAYVQTTRILRESTSNIIKHSGATHCSIRVAIEEGDFQLVIQDDGNGITEEVDARLDRGHGLASMKNRAKQLQGQCLIESGAGYGTVIRLTLPLDTALGMA
jgi:two-component system, NarL family, sensor histidine kinase UhpB